MLRAVDTGLEIEVAGEANGTVKIDLLEDVAPAHVAQITELAEEGAYDGVVFHRVIDGFMAQTGDVEFGKTGSEAFSMGRAGTGGSASIGKCSAPRSLSLSCRQSWSHWRSRK